MTGAWFPARNGASQPDLPRGTTPPHAPDTSRRRNPVPALLEQNRFGQLPVRAAVPRGRVAPVAAGPLPARRVVELGPCPGRDRIAQGYPMWTGTASRGRLSHWYRVIERQNRTGTSSLRVGQCVKLAHLGVTMLTIGGP